MKADFSDSNIFQITKLLYSEFEEEQKQKKLDQEKLTQFKKDHIKPLYPHKTINHNGSTQIQKYNCQQFCCQLNPGRFCCCYSTKPDKVYEEFGLGICIYTKFMKHLTFFLFVVTVIAIIPILLYLMVGIYNQYPLTQSYSNTLFSSSIGIISSSYLQCSYKLIQDDKTAKFDLRCPIGAIKLIGLTFSNDSKSEIQNCRIQQEKFVANRYIPENYNQVLQCDSQNKFCNISISLSELTHTNSSSYQYEFVSYSYQCVDSIYTLGQLQLTDQIILYIIVGIDLLIILSFTCFLVSEHFSEKNQIDNFKKTKLSLDDFSVKIEGFTVKHLLEQLDYFIKFYNNDQENIKNDHVDILQDDMYNNIVSIKITETEQYLDCVQKHREKYQQLFRLIDQSFFQQKINPKKYEDYQEFIKKCFGSQKSQDYQIYKKLLQDNIREFIASRDIKYYDQQSRNSKTSLILVFSNPLYKRKLYKSAKKSCFRDKITVYNDTYYISKAPVADMIIWENHYKWTCCRSIFAWIVTLLFCFCSYLLVGVAQYQKNKLATNNQFDQDCNIMFKGVDFSSYNSDMTNTRGYVHCYCFQQFFQNSFQIGSRCTQWITDYALYLAIPVLISLGIVIYNLLISKIFKYLSKFQGHSSLTAQLFSYTLKRTFVLIMNMGLIIILLNIHYQEDWNNQNFQFLFQGSYSDITSDWYFKIGVIITITLCFNIFLPIMQIILTSFLKCLRKMWDTNCCTKKTSKKTKKQYIDLYSGDVFPLEERYADLLSILAITLAFSAALPIMFLIAFLSIGFMFLSDKVLLFKIFQKPLNFTSDLHDNVFKAIFFLLVMHSVITPILLSAPGLLQASGILELDLLFESGNQRFDRIMKSGYLLPYVIIFLIFIVWTFVYIVVIQVCTFCIQKCQRKIKLLHKTKLNANFLATLNNYQLNRLKFSTEKQMAMIDALSKVSTLRSSNNQIQVTQDNIMESQRKTYLSQNILKKTVKQIQKLLILPSKARLTSLNNVSLIGRAGYDDSFDDQVLYRDKKIKLLENHLKKLSNAVSTSRNKKSLQADLREQMTVHVLDDSY